MQQFFRTHPKIKWTGITVLSLVAILVVVSLLFDWNMLRGPLAREISAKTGRPTRIDGDLKVHLWSLNPRIEVNGLKIANPPWAERQPMFGAARLTVSVSLLRLLRGQWVLPLIELSSPTINLQRDAKGRASWELGTRQGTPHDDGRPAQLPTINRLIIDSGSLHVDDQVRKLVFSGSLTAAEEAGRDNSSAFQIRSSGSLNAKPFHLDANGGPLLDLGPDKPYTFTAHLTAADINLESRVRVNKPFDLGDVDMKFVVSGADLADVYYLTGLALPNTPNYRLAATVVVRGTDYHIGDLKGRLGSSDLEGDMDVKMIKARPVLTGKLHSEKLDLADLAPTLGQPASKSDSITTHASSTAQAEPRLSRSPAEGPQGKPSAAHPNGLLLPDADLQVNRVRGMDADVTYRAAAVIAPKLPLKDFTLHVVLKDGVLTLNPVSFGLDQGTVAGRAEIDARKDDPVTDIDMRIGDVQLDEFKSAKMQQAPLDGTLVGRFKFHGIGSSVHKLASTADGAVSVVIPHGEINEAIAQLTGINVLKGLGLLLSDKQKKVDIRCGILDFKDQSGTLRTTTVYVDTSSVLITGRGNIDFSDEDIHLALQGDPKKLTLIRLRTPITVGGTLLDPSIGVSAGKLAEQAGIATALGVLLTPAAAALAFIDPGLAKNKDCATVFAQANAGVESAANVTP